MEIFSDLVVSDIESIYDERVIDNLIQSLVNAFVYKYPAGDFENNNYELPGIFWENGLTFKQREILRCPYQRKNTVMKVEGYPLTLKIVFKDSLGNRNSFFIDVDEKTGIVDDYSIMFLAEYYYGLSNNITAEKLVEIMKKQNLPFVDYSDIVLFLEEREEIKDIRKKVIFEVAKWLYDSDEAFETGKYRMEKFLEEFNLVYEMDMDIKEIGDRIISEGAIKMRNKKLGF